MTVGAFLEEIQKQVEAGELSIDARVLTEDARDEYGNAVFLIDEDGDLIIF